MATIRTRKSVPIDHATGERIERVRSDKDLLRAAARHAAPGRLQSEASLLAVVFRLGLDALEREADEDRYAALAAAEDAEDQLFHAALRSRRGVEQ